MSDNSDNVMFVAELGLYSCTTCGKTFKQKSNARTHYQGVHLNLRQKCDLCGIQVRKLKGHLNDVHKKDLLVTCHLCGKQYFQGRLFKDHMRRTHHVDNEGNMTQTSASEEYYNQINNSSITKYRIKVMELVVLFVLLHP